MHSFHEDSIFTIPIGRTGNSSTAHHASRHLDFHRAFHVGREYLDTETENIFYYGDSVVDKTIFLRASKRRGFLASTLPVSNYGSVCLTSASTGLFVIVRKYESESRRTVLRRGQKSIKRGEGIRLQQEVDDTQKRKGVL